MIETLLDGNRSLEMLEWCETNLTPGTWAFQELSQVNVSLNSPRLLHWAWHFTSDVAQNKFSQQWPLVYQLIDVYHDSGSELPVLGLTGKIIGSKRLGDPDTWCGWAQASNIPFETHRVTSTGQWCYTMGQPIPNRFDIRYFRFAHKEDATQFTLTWHLV